MILCCGEALIDMIPHPTTAGRDGYVPHPGGGLLNTAIALGRLGLPAGVFTGLSTDLFGEFLVRALADSHVDTTLSVRSARPTTLAFTHIVGGDARYSFHDENTAGRMLTPDDLPALPDVVSTLLFGGFSLAVEPCADAYAALLDRAGADRVVMIDPNVRPGFIDDEARYRARLDRMLRRADIVKLSDADLDWLMPGPASEADSARAISALGPAVVIVTRGALGAAGYLSGDRTVAVPAVPASVVDTIGAGDTFNAGVLAGLHRAGVLDRDGVRNLDPATLTAALELGARAAAVTVGHSGANPPWLAELGED
ncbi:carbohydrate kinase [Oceanicola sp. 22II-s10i]|uniref:carbohydrate kinase family protein n=1 Tax=Oceanicola sp. 22II-s10i TaxID=1317116 RepID=UPI000B525230|nr:carbohydrate kinase [Oceanicola sp. 22II-s10i]OWU84382.1 carbohydrate kinase [Oceanicola sp. 22II-s10i]